MTDVAVVTPESRWLWTGAMNRTGGLWPILDTFMLQTSLFSATANRTAVVALGERNLLEISFAGTGTEDTKAEIAVYLVSGLGNTNGPDAYRTLYALKVNAILGKSQKNTTYPFGGTTYRLVDEIIPVTDVSSTPPGARIMGNVTDGWASIAIDKMGATHAILDFNNITSTTMGALYRTV